MQVIKSTLFRHRRVCVWRRFCCCCGRGGCVTPQNDSCNHNNNTMAPCEPPKTIRKILKSAVLVGANRLLCEKIEPTPGSPPSFHTFYLEGGEDWWHIVLWINYVHRTVEWLVVAAWESRLPPFRTRPVESKTCCFRQPPRKNVFNNWTIRPRYIVMWCEWSVRRSAYEFPHSFYGFIA